MALVASLACPAAASAGHELFVTLVFEPGANRVVAGVPISRRTAIRDTKRLVLIGAQPRSYRVLARWPGGSIQWVLVDADVDQPERARIYLTTGKPTVSNRSAPSESAPVIARASAVAVYNDADVLPEMLAEAFGTSADEKDLTFANLNRHLRDLLRCSDEDCQVYLVAARRKLESLLDPGTGWSNESPSGLPGETLSLWYCLTGDDEVLARYLLWGQAYSSKLSQASRALNDDDTFQLVDLWRWSGNATYLDQIEAGIASSAAGARTLRRLLTIGDLDAEQQDRVLDRLDAISFTGGETIPLSLVERAHRLTHAYRISGEMEYLDWANGLIIMSSAASGDPGFDHLRYLVEETDRQPHWRPLLLSEEATNAGFRLSWSTPDHALRYRMKRFPQGTEVTAKTFHEGETIPGLAIPGESGDPEVRLVETATGEASTFRGRYLEASEFDQREGKRISSTGSFSFEPLAGETSAVTQAEQSENSDDKATTRIAVGVLLAIMTLYIFLAAKRRQ